MTLYLENTSEKKTITLRYGDGNNKMIQLNPQEKKPLPLEITKQKLQAYLHLFRDIKLIEDSEPVKVEESKSSKKELGDVNIVKNDNGESGQDDSSNELDSTKELEDGEQDDNGESGQDDGQEGQDDSSKDGDESESDSQSSGDAKDDNGESGQDDGQDDGQEAIKFTERELNSLKAEQVKELAKTLGIEVTEESTKKALIPVILNKQGMIE